jgi:hypothetical protein
MKAILLVLAKNDKYPYTKAIEEIRNSYFSVESPNIVEKLFYIGGSVEFVKDKDILHCNVEDNLINIINKTHIAFKYVYQNYDFDYIIRANSGSYVNIENLCNLLSTAPKSNLYGGVIGNAELGRFVSGSMYVLSKDLVEKFVLDDLYCKVPYMYSYTDDVSLSRYFLDNNIELTEHKYRQDLFSYACESAFLENLDKTKCQYYFRTQNYRFFSKIHNILNRKN